MQYVLFTDYEIVHEITSMAIVIPLRIQEGLLSVTRESMAGSTR